jgi:hypothetical protein
LVVARHVQHEGWASLATTKAQRFKEFEDGDASIGGAGVDFVVLAIDHSDPR